MVVALAVLDAAVGISLVVDGVRSESAGSRYVGAALLLCAVVLGAVPWLTEASAVPLQVPALSVPARHGTIRSAEVVRDVRVRAGSARPRLGQSTSGGDPPVTEGQGTRG